MNRLSSFFRRILKKQEEPKQESFKVKAPKPSKRTRVTTHAIKSKGYAFSQYGNGAFKSLPRFIEMGSNNGLSIEYHKRHIFEAAK